MRRTRHQKKIETRDENFFNRLPNEILVDVIKYVRTFNFEESIEIARRKETHAVSSDLGHLPIWTYQSPPIPILNSFQAFASVNRRIYELSRHLLWETIEFPSSVPKSISLWVDSILPRQGIHVKSVKITSTEGWFHYYPKHIKITRSLNSRYHQYSLRPRALKQIKTKNDEIVLGDLDNLSLFRFPWSSGRFSLNSQGLSIKNVIEILSLTPYLHTFEFTTPPSDYYEPSARDMRVFEVNLGCLLDQLPHLRHFKIRAPPVSSLLSTAIAEPITKVPLLESLACSDILQGSKKQIETFAKSISGLQHLTKLQLSHVYDFDQSWQSIDGPPKLVQLEIESCYNLWLTKAPRLISTWAPKLTHLSLSFCCNLQSQIDDVSNFDTNRYQFDLPHLTHLTLWHRDECGNYYECFKGCKKLDTFTYHALGEESCEEFVEWICKGNLPNLRTLNLPQPCSVILEKSDEIERAFDVLNNHADQHGLKVVHSITWGQY